MPLSIPDQSIAMQAKAPDSMTAISGMLNMARSAQALKTSQATYDSDVSSAASAAQTAQAGARVATANVQPMIDQQAANTSTAQTGAQSARFKLTGEQQGIVNQISSGLISDPAINSGDSEKMLPLFKAAHQRMIDSGVPENMADVGYAHLVVAAHNNPSAIPQILRNSILQSQVSTQQAAATQLSGISVGNGQQSRVINTNQYAGPIGVAIPGTEQQAQLPPTTPTMGGKDGTTPGYIGPQPDYPPAPATATQSDMQVPPKVQVQRDGTRLEILTDELAHEKDPASRAAIQREIMRAQMHLPQSAAAPRSGFVQSGLPAGAAQGITGTQDQINKHWADTQASAGSAQQDIGVLQNIKQHAAGAATGVFADRQALVSGIAGLLGMSSGELAKTNTDLLAKNSNMLALAGGDTNLARTMAEAATPNNHMTKEAISQAADQVIGQRKLALARAQFLTQPKAMADQGHTEAYTSAKNAFDSVADPRILQFESMSDKEAGAMIGSMSKKEQADFRQKYDKAIKLGIAK